MRVLGIETSTSNCQVAVSDGRSIRAAIQLPCGAKPTATLVPATRDLVRSVGWALREIELVAVDIGPGSYTGLRVGLTCAKILAFAAGAPLAAVGSLEIVARNVIGAGPIEVGFDAARGQVFAARFQRGDQQTWTAIEPVRIVEANQWARSLDPSVLVLGPALMKYQSLFSRTQRIAHESDWWPQAAQVIELSALQLQLNALASYWELEPIYLRLSAAEEKKFTHRTE